MATVEHEWAQDPPPHDTADHCQPAPAGHFETQPAVAGHLDHERGQGVAAVEGKTRQGVEDGQGQVDQGHGPYGEGDGNRQTHEVLHPRSNAPDEQVGGRS